MKLEKLIIALLALYIIYCFMSKEKYAFDEPGVDFPVNDPNVGFVDIYLKQDTRRRTPPPQTARGRGRSSPPPPTTPTTTAEVSVVDRVEFTDNISLNKNFNLTDNNSSVVIRNFTSRIPKSVTAYGVNYNDNGTVNFYQLMNFFNNTNIRLQMKPGNELILRNLNLATNLGATSPVDETPIHAARFVFTF
jgi:hypothetical protein